MMKTLRDLYREHEGKVSDKWDIYLEEYDRIFHAYRNHPVKLLEIGVQNGGSLEVWQKYFPNAVSLIGCDINEKCRNLEFDSDRISVVVGDANSSGAEAEIKEISDEFDIIIDDGSHTSGDIIKSFAKYFPYLKDGGVFVAEDLHCSYWGEFNGGLYHPLSSISFFKQLSDIPNYEHWGTSVARSEVIDIFKKAYSIDLEEDDLVRIHSVEFINSMCVIRKLSADRNELGPRNIAGTKELVVPGHKGLEGQTNKALCQRSNAESELHPYEQILNLRSETDRLRKQLDDKATEVSTIVQSRSWKLTKPLRYLNRKLGSVRLLLQNIRLIVRMTGGKNVAFRKVLGLLRAEGLSALPRLVSFLVSRTRDPGQLYRFDYNRWLSEYERPACSADSNYRNRIEALNDKPLISIIMPVYNPNLDWLIEAVDSILKQTYENWELCIADDKSTDPDVGQYLRALAEQEPRVKICFRPENGHISAASNSALDLAEGEWLALVDQDDLLRCDALISVVEAINAFPEGRLFYSDEDKIDEKGRRFGPYFKSDWNKYLFYSHNLITHLGVYSRGVVSKIGGFRAGVEGAQDYDLALRFIEQIDESQIVHIPKILYHWRAHGDSTASGIDAKNYAIEAGKTALEDHFQRVGLSSSVTPVRNGYRVNYSIPQPAPMVSIIVPTRNGLSYLRTCIESLLSRTEYENKEILIVDNGSDDPDCLHYLEKMQNSYEYIKVIKDDRPFNFSELNNRAVENASGEVILLMNNDVEAIEAGWLTEMVSLAVQDDVGAVGAKLLYPNGTIQHAGVVLGLGGAAGHVHQFFEKDDPGYAGRLSLINQYSAVTAACLAVKRRLYLEVGGLDDSNFAVAYNDVDFCLKLREMGYKNIYTPYAVLYHHESVSRGYEDTPEKRARFELEKSRLVEKWPSYIERDPCYNPNLTKDFSDFSLAWPPRLKE